MMTYKKKENEQKLLTDLYVLSSRIPKRYALELYIPVDGGRGPLRGHAVYGRLAVDHFEDRTGRCARCGYRLQVRGGEADVLSALEDAEEYL